MVAYALFTNWGIKSLAVVAALLGCAAIGFADDWLKVMRKRSLGLQGALEAARPDGRRGRHLARRVPQDVSTEVFVPIVDFHVDLGPAWYALVFLMVLGATNAVNLTDGLDGLASGITALVMLVFTGMAVVGYQAGQRAVTACLTIDRTSVLPSAGR